MFAAVALCEKFGFRLKSGRRPEEDFKLTRCVSKAAADEHVVVTVFIDVSRWSDVFSNSSVVDAGCVLEVGLVGKGSSRSVIEPQHTSTKRLGTVERFREEMVLITVTVYIPDTGDDHAEQLTRYNGLKGVIGCPVVTCWRTVEVFH